jgi:hypothetical protein
MAKDIYGLAQQLVASDTKTEHAITQIMAEGVSRSTALRYIKKARGQEARPDWRPKKIIKPKEIEASRAIATLHTVEFDERADHYYKDGDERPSAKIIAAARDMEQLRRDAMQKGTKEYDPRVAIAAAMAESQVLINSARLAKEMRDSSRDDITLHPQFARFREEMVKMMDGTPLGEAFRNGMAMAIEIAKKVPS